MPKRRGRKSAAQTPAPPKERITGSKKNPKGSASSESTAKGITLSAKIIETLKNKLAEFKKKHPNKKNVTLNDLKAVFRRGAGAYSKSHRPTITGGVPNSRNAWAFARVNKFLKKAGGEKVKEAYIQDDDLLKMEGGGTTKNLGFHWTDEDGIKGIVSDNQWNGGSVTSNPKYKFEQGLANYGLIFDLNKIENKYKREVEEYSQAPFKEWEIVINKKISLTNDAFLGLVVRNKSEVKNLKKIVSGETTYFKPPKEWGNKYPIFILKDGKLVRQNTDKEIAEANYADGGTIDGYSSEKKEVKIVYEKEEDIVKFFLVKDGTKPFFEENIIGRVKVLFDYNYFLVDISEIYPDLKDEDRVVELRTILIDEKYRTSGNGTILINAVLTWLKKNKIDYVFSVASGDSKLQSVKTKIKFLKKFGFTNYKLPKSYGDLNVLGLNLKKHNYADGGATLLAPNGKPSNLTPEQWKLVRTSEFKNWFGDWENDPENASKVVDENGEPLVVWHKSTSIEPFSEFDKKYINKNDPDFWSNGFWFSRDIGNTASWTNLGGDGFVKPFFLNVRNILKNDKINEYEETYEYEIEENDGTSNRLNLIKRGYDGVEFEKIINPIHILNQMFNRNEKIYIDRKSHLRLGKSSVDLVYHYIENGQNVDDIYLDTYLGKKLEKQTLDYQLSKIEDLIKEGVIIAFEPNQIKLADGTNTTFEPTNPDIRYADGGTIGGFEDLTDKWLSQKIEIFLDKVKPIKFYYVNPETNTLIVGFDKYFSIDAAKKVYKEATSSEEFFDADSVESTFDKETGDTIFRIKLKKMVEYKKGGKLLNPKGRESNLTPEQYKLVRTPEFKAWFGDWENKPKSASKVLDPAGEPLVVYHGSTSKFNKFDEMRSGSNVWRVGVVGFYFSDYDEVAKLYTYDDNKGRYLDKSYARPFFLNIRKLKVIDVQNKKWFLPSLWNDKYDEIISKAKRDGYDGVVLKNISDMLQGAKRGKSYLDYWANTYVVFDPKNIKLADGRNVTFNPKTDDIRYADGGVSKSKKLTKKRKIEAKGDCYVKAGEFAMGKVFAPAQINYIGTPYVVHAEVVGQGIIEGIRYGHAWVEDDYLVYDYSNGRELQIPKELYYAIGQVNKYDRKKYRRYTFAEAKKKMLETGHYGCWDIETEYAKGGETNETCEKLDSKGERKIDPKSIEELTKCVESLPQTKTFYFDEDKEQYSPERRELHRKIIYDIKKNITCIQKRKPIAILMGGSPASGKSTFVRKYAPYLMKDDILKVDADEIRAKLPEYKGYNASQTHLETKDIVTTLLSDRNIGLPCAYDILYDGTMNNVKNYEPLVRLLKSLGYSIYIIYIDKVPKDVVKQRNLDRYKRTGRFVPLAVIDDFFEKGTQALDKLKPQVDGYMVVDGSDGKYSVIEKGGKSVPKTRSYEKIGYHPELTAKDVIKEFMRGGRMERAKDASEIINNLDFDPLSSEGSLKLESFEDGGEIKFNEPVFYHEKNGNWLIPKNQIYFWLYDVSDAHSKLSSGEFEFVFFPPNASIPMRMRRDYVPPLMKIWTKKYQRGVKGSEHLIGILKAWYDEKNNKVYIEMMTTRKDMRKKGVMGYLVKDLREYLNIPKENVVFDKPTAEGTKFYESGKYADGGDLKKTTFSDRYGKNRFVELSKEDLNDYAEELLGLIQNSYKHLGGHHEFLNLENFKNTELNFWVAQDLDSDPEADVLLAGKTTPFGTKITTSGQDGSTTAKMAMVKKMTDLMKTEGFYAEMDENLANKFNLDIITDENVIRKVINKPDLVFVREGVYTRAIGGQYTKEKVLVGMPPKDNYAKGGELSEDEKKETYKKWKTLVNMSKGELKKFYDSIEGKRAGLTPEQAKSAGIDSGRESARWIMKMKDTPVAKWTPNMWRWAKKQISFVSRMSGNKGSLYDEKGRKTRKHTSLLIWGHNPEKKSAGGTIDLKSKGYDMNEYIFNNLPCVDGIEQGQKFLLKEEVFVKGENEPKHHRTRYMVVQAMSRGGMLDSLNLKVLYTFGEDSLMENQIITRPIKNVLNKGRELSETIKSSFKDGGQLDPDKKEIKGYVEHISGSAGGLLVGKRHSEGGIKAINKSTGDKIEMEGGEVVITRDAVSDPSLHEFNGKKMTNREILSAINESGGGVAFADGGDVSCKCAGKSYKFGGKLMTDKEIVERLNRGYGSKDAIKKGMEIEDKEHGQTFKLLQHGDIDYEKFLKRLVTDHLSEDPNYYENYKKHGKKD